MPVWRLVYCSNMKKWVTLAFLCLAFFFYMSDRQLFGLLVPLIQEDTGLSKLQIGLVDTVLYWVVAIMMPFSGFAGDRWPRTRVITVAILGWGALTLLTGFAGAVPACSNQFDTGQSLTEVLELGKPSSLINSWQHKQRTFGIKPCLRHINTLLAI